MKTTAAKIKQVSVFSTILFLSALLTACATSSQQKGEVDAKKTVNCATAEADIKALESEKAQVADQVVAGVTSIVPIGLVTGVATGTAGTKARVATGDYNKMLDKKIAEIKQQCGIE